MHDSKERKRLAKYGLNIYLVMFVDCSDSNNILKECVVQERSEFEARIRAKTLFDHDRHYCPRIRKAGCYRIESCEV